MKLHAQLRLDSTEQAFVFGLRRTVQAIGAFFQTFAVFDGQAAAARLQQRLTFEGLQSFRYSGATDSQHQREKLMREQPVFLRYCRARWPRQYSGLASRRRGHSEASIAAE